MLEVIKSLELTIKPKIIKKKHYEWVLLGGVFGRFFVGFSHANLDDNTHRA